MNKLFIILLSLGFAFPVSAQDVSQEQLVRQMRISRRKTLSACASNKPQDYAFHLELYKVCLDFERNSIAHIEFMENFERNTTWTELAEYERHLEEFESDMKAVLAALKDSTQELKLRNTAE